MIISKTPFRISFFGGGTDYPVWFEEHGGAVLSTSIDKYCYITARYLPPFFKHKHRLVYSKVENVMNTQEILHPAIKEVFQFLNVDKGMEIHHDGDLPARSGLGSSSSFTVGLLHSLYALKGKIVSQDKLARHAIHVERDLLNENVGSQDQIAAAHGGFNKIEFLKGHDYKVTPMTLSNNKVEELQDNLMLFFTGLSRFASEIAHSQISNTHKKQDELRTMLDMVDHSIDILAGNDNINEFGKLLNESWKLKKSLSDKISNQLINDIYDTALRAGAFGGKILGAGGGGFMLFFVPPERQESVRAVLKDLLEIPFTFSREGSQIIYYSPNEYVNKNVKRWNYAKERAEKII